MTKVAIRRALISVHDKTGLAELAGALAGAGVEVVSTGSTAAAIAAAGAPVTPLWQVTGFPECLDGRVKTLHPAVHAGLLANTGLPRHLRQLDELGIAPFELLVSNLYPFEATVAGGAAPAECVEQIDIGGPAMVRAAAKNHRWVAVITDPSQYPQAVAAVRDGGFTLPQRQRLAARAYAHTARYDAAVASWFASVYAPDGTARDSGWPDIVAAVWSRREVLRYGENPHQSAALYLGVGGPGGGNVGVGEPDGGEPGSRNLGGGEPDGGGPGSRNLGRGEPGGGGPGSRNLGGRHPGGGEPDGGEPDGGELGGRELGGRYLGGWNAGGGTGVATAEQLHGKAMSYNNYVDAAAAWRAAFDFPQPCVAIIKHSNPCGIAVGADLAEAHRKAHACDPVSAYGGVIAANGVVTEDMARQVAEVFTEVLIAPGFADAALGALTTRKNLRLLKCPRPVAGASNAVEWHPLGGGLLMQTADRLDAPGDDPAAWQLRAGPAATPETVADLAFAWRACRSVKSNAIVIATGGATVGVGMGQVNRVDSARLAVGRSGERAVGAVAASDAFFPFADGLEVLAAAGVRAVVEPGGSVRDADVIAVAEGAGVSLYFTGTRHFFH